MNCQLKRCADWADDSWGPAAGALKARASSVMGMTLLSCSSC
jgi:hypothetical protein